MRVRPCDTEMCFEIILNACYLGCKKFTNLSHIPLSSSKYQKMSFILQCFELQIKELIRKIFIDQYEFAVKTYF